MTEPAGTTRPSDLVKDPLPGSGPETRATVEDVTEAMKDVVDPELMVNVVDLGLVYGIHLDDDIPRQDGDALMDLLEADDRPPLGGRLPLPNGQLRGLVPQTKERTARG